jgi:flavorubredoxin
MKKTSISNSILYIGVDDKTIDMFEGQYAAPHGISYNSYMIYR